MMPDMPHTGNMARLPRPPPSASPTFAGPAYSVPMPIAPSPLATLAGTFLCPMSVGDGRAAACGSNGRGEPGAIVIDACDAPEDDRPARVVPRRGQP